jgi:hypothetical protein
MEQLVFELNKVKTENKYLKEYALQIAHHEPQSSVDENGYIPSDNNDPETTSEKAPDTPPNPTHHHPNTV